MAGPRPLRSRRKDASSSAEPASATPPAVPSAKPKPLARQADAENAVLRNLLALEAAARKAQSERELASIMANETRQLSRAQQVFVVERKSRNSPFCVIAVSSIPVVDRNVPLVGWIERMIARLTKTDGIGAMREFMLPAYCDEADPEIRSYPFENFLWLPLWVKAGDRSHGLLLARQSPWTDADRRIAERLAETFGHALSQLRGTFKPIRSAVWSWRWMAALAATLVALGLMPVPITALAPVEVVAHRPEMVTMPVDAVIAEVLVSPNDTVVEGQVLVRLVDTVSRNKLRLAEREVAVAEARVERANSLAFSQSSGRHELGIARAELALRMAEYQYARDLLQQSSVVARGRGIAVFSSRKDLEGKPMRTGEVLMQIARPGQIALKIDLPVADSIVMRPGAPLRVFLDSDPLNAIQGEVTHVDYQARLTEANVASYRVAGRLKERAGEPPRLGTRGTAQVYGPVGSLALYFFRRPLSALRQWAGL